jgi:hypothetical protein
MAESIKLMDSKMESRKEGQKAFFKAGGTVRSANFSKVEKSILAELVDIYKDVLENKKTDAATSKVCITKK